MAPVRPPRLSEPSPLSAAGREVDLAAVRDVAERAARGDPGAFEELYARYVGVVHRYAYVRLGSREAAEDATMETFARALRGIRGFAWQGKDPGAWLITICRNLILDLFASSRYRLEAVAAELPERGSDGDAVEVEVAARITCRVVLDYVRLLDPAWQECLTLRFLQGLSVAETARIMGRSPGAVKALQHRALRRLQELIPDTVGR